MTEPTDGPWIIGTIKANHADIPEDALGIWPATITETSIEYGQPVCLVSPLSTLSETDLANAQLIASAPELLKTLKALADSYQDFVHDAHEDTEYQNALAAIARATQSGLASAPSSLTRSPVTLNFSSGQCTGDTPPVADECRCPWCGDDWQPLENGSWPECSHCGGN